MHCAVSLLSAILRLIDVGRLAREKLIVKGKSAIDKRVLEYNIFAIVKPRIKP
jgi:hypothetical protein